MLTNHKCYNCRESLRSLEYWAKSIKPNAQRYWLYSFVDLSYLYERDGLGTNIKKGLNFLQKAAKMGEEDAQDALARFYFSGKFLPEDFKEQKQNITPRRQLIEVTQIHNMFLQN